MALIRDAGLPVSTKAECLLALNGESLLVHPIKVMSEEFINQLNTNVVHDYMISLNPNPASNNLTAGFTLPTDGASYSLKIIDDYQEIGKIMTTQSITGTSSISVNVNSYISGIYTVVIYRNDLSVATAQLSIVH